MIFRRRVATVREHVLPARRLEARVAILAPQGDGRAVLRLDGERQPERLAAGAPAVGRMHAVAADADEPPVLHIGQQAAADAAVRALGRGGLHYLAGWGRAVSLRRPFDERSVNGAARRTRVGLVPLGGTFPTSSAGPNRLIEHNAVMDLPDDLVLPLRSGESWWYWLGGRPSLDFVNTLRERWWRNVETLVTPEDLALWLRARRAAGAGRGHAAVDGASTSRARAAREHRCRPRRGDRGRGDRAARAADDRLVAAGRGDVRDARAGPGRGAGLAASAPADPLEHALGLVALDAARMLGTPEQRARARICASETCSARFYDRSPTAGRLWCSMRACGNVAKARRHRERAREASQS